VAWFTIGLVAMGLALPGCAPKVVEPVGDPGPGGAYHYTAYDQNAKPVLQGTLTLVLDGDKVSGSWALQVVSDRAGDAGLLANLGPQIGSGELVGVRKSDGQLQLNLNPEQLDNNVFLDAAYHLRVLSGAWTHIGFAGPLSSGSFTATKQ
jgi:hypothetical protein